jgi:hypothetical protein
MPRRLATCVLLLAIAPHAGPVRADVAAARAQTVAYLQKLQTESGGFLPAAGLGDKAAPSLRATSAAVRAFHYLGGTLQKRDAVARFVESCFEAKSGGFGDGPKGKADLYATAVGLMAVAELKLPGDKFVSGGLKYLDEQAKTFEDVRIAVAAFEAVKRTSPRAEDWLRLIRDMENFDGSYGKDAGRARATASAVVAIMRLGGSVANQIVVLTALQEGQHDNGGWGRDNEDINSDLESSYRVMRAFVMLKRPPVGLEGIRNFVAKCRNDDGGYGLAPGQASTVAATYFAAIINHWADQMERNKDQ